MFAGAMVYLGRQWRSGEGEVEVRVVVNPVPRLEFLQVTCVIS